MKTSEPVIIIDFNHKYDETLSIVLGISKSSTNFFLINVVQGITEMM